MITGGWRTASLSVEVSPGGALTAISLTPQAIRLGPDGLASAILGAVARASAIASQRVRGLGFGGRELAMLGLDDAPELVESAESTTPERWSLP